MANSMSQIIKLTIECVDLPAHDWGGHTEIWLGIQAGKEVVQKVKLPSDKVAFEADLRIGNESSDGVPNFLGPYAHGTVQDRFLYLCWGMPVGPHWVGFRRAKLPLSSLTWQLIANHHVLARVKCTDSKGGPACATLKGDSLIWTSM